MALLDRVSDAHVDVVRAPCALCRGRRAGSRSRAQIQPTTKPSGGETEEAEGKECGQAATN